ncbi:MAG: hypothetical protein M3437_01270 [Chloroflexota bacterium]|nr:hypothetical protein [Chloroflexota bacterium]MDQ5866377.1 hypothetical protein [Chloroflexota bacterium]
MARNMMWNELEGQYRGQAEQGEVVTVAEDAMKLAHKRAGNWAFEADWWVETLTRVLEHWGLFSKRWVDPATQVVRVHFTLGEPKSSGPSLPTGPLSARIMSGPLDRNKNKPGS